MIQFSSFHDFLKLLCLWPRSAVANKKCGFWLVVEPLLTNREPYFCLVLCSKSGSRKKTTWNTTLDCFHESRSFPSHSMANQNLVYRYILIANRRRNLELVSSPESWNGTPGVSRTWERRGRSDNRPISRVERFDWTELKRFRLNRFYFERFQRCHNGSHLGVLSSSAFWLVDGSNPWKSHESLSITHDEVDRSLMDTKKPDDLIRGQNFDPIEPRRLRIVLWMFIPFFLSSYSMTIVYNNPWKMFWKRVHYPPWTRSKP